MFSRSIDFVLVNSTLTPFRPRLVSVGGLNSINVFFCRGGRLLRRWQEDRPGGDHRTGVSEGPRVLVKRGGPRRHGEPQRAGHALRRGGGQAATVHQQPLLHLHTREHAWRTAVSAAYVSIRSHTRWRQHPQTHPHVSGGCSHICFPFDLYSCYMPLIQDWTQNDIT